MVLAEVGIRLAGAGSIHESVQTGSAVLCVSMGILTVILWKRFAGDGKNAPASSLAEAVTDVAMLTARNAATSSLGDTASNVVTDVLEVEHDS